MKRIEYRRVVDKFFHAIKKAALEVEAEYDAGTLEDPDDLEDANELATALRIKIETETEWEEPNLDVPIGATFSIFEGTTGETFEVFDAEQFRRLFRDKQISEKPKRYGYCWRKEDRIDDVDVVFVKTDVIPKSEKRDWRANDDGETDGFLERKVGEQFVLKIENRRTKRLVLCEVVDTSNVSSGCENCVAFEYGDIPLSTPRKECWNAFPTVGKCCDRKDGKSVKFIPRKTIQ